MTKTTFSLCVLATVWVGCGSGLERAEAENLIRASHFGDGHGLVLQINLQPSGEMRDSGMGGLFSLPLGDCSRPAIAWPGPYPGGSHECIRALASLGLVTCGSARVGNWMADGPTIEDITPLPMGCGERLGGMDVRLPEDRPLLVAMFAPTAVTTAACSSFLDRSETSLLGRRGPLGYPDSVTLSIIISDSMTLGEVTGIADGATGTKIAEFTWTANVERVAPLVAANACTLGAGHWPTSAARTSRATLRHFDDGWRVESVDWGRP